MCEGEMASSALRLFRAGRHFLSAKLGGCIKEKPDGIAQKSARLGIMRGALASGKPPTPRAHNKKVDGYRRGGNKKKSAISADSLTDFYVGVDFADEAFEDVARTEFVEFGIGVGVGFGIGDHILNRLRPANGG